MKGLSFCRKKNGLNCSKIIIKIQLRMVFPFSQILNADVFLELRKTTRHIGKKFIICYKSYFVQTKYIGYIHDEIYRINEGCTNTPLHSPWLRAWFMIWYLICSVTWKPPNYELCNTEEKNKPCHVLSKNVSQKKGTTEVFPLGLKLT